MTKDVMAEQPNKEELTAYVSYAAAAATTIANAPLLLVVGVCAAIGFGCKMLKKMFS
ncbi:MAG: hypothetical protein GX946_07145 [Oligosphaeraceae bacterium]|nr:hypothetical protein [Oligosphaeraceae bacterium]